MNWRVGFVIEPAARFLCETWGMTPADFARDAIRRRIDEVTSQWFNYETFAIAHFIDALPEWTEIAYGCDDFLEFQHALEARGIRETPNGIKLKSKRIAQKRLSAKIRSIRKGA